MTPPPTWEDLAWLRGQWDGPLMVKGVMRVDDARRAVEARRDRDLGLQPRRQQPRRHAGVDPRAAGAIVEAVGDAVEIVLDGGIRRGSDVVKALALGARAVMIGRAVPVGPRRQRPGRRRERARHPAQRHRLHAARPRSRVGGRAQPRRPPDPGWLRAPAWLSCPRRPWPAICSSCRSARPSNTARICRWAPTRSSLRRSLQRLDAVVAPALPYGSSGEHAGFPGTLSIGREALEHVLVELARSAGFARVLFLCAHGGNAEPLAAAVRVLRAEGRDVRAWSPRWDGDAHAGRTETSLMLALAPELVGASREPRQRRRRWPS